MSRGVATVVAGAALAGPAWASASASAPGTVTLEVRSKPSGLVLASGGRAVATPWTSEVAAGARTTLSAPAVVRRRGTTYRFDRWSDEGAARHTLVIPPTDALVTAAYRPDKAAGRPVVATGSTWRVDLGARRAVDTVLVGRPGAGYVVEVSDDGRAYVRAATVRRTGPGSRRVLLGPRAARFVRIRTVAPGTAAVRNWDVAVLGGKDPVGPPAPPATPPPPARPAFVPVAVPAPVPAPAPAGEPQLVQGSAVGWVAPLDGARWLLGS